MINHQKTWDNYHKFADQRGELVTKIISQFTKIKNKNILDIGCGDGGTSLKFAQLGAHVTAIDIRSDLITSYTLNARAARHLSESSLLLYGGSMTYENFDVFDEMDNFKFSGNIKYRFTNSAGFTAPSSSLSSPQQ